MAPPRLHERDGPVAQCRAHEVAEERALDRLGGGPALPLPHGAEDEHNPLGQHREREGAVVEAVDGEPLRILDDDDVALHASHRVHLAAEGWPAGHDVQRGHVDVVDDDFGTDRRVELDGEAAEVAYAGGHRVERARHVLVHDAGEL